MFIFYEVPNHCGEEEIEAMRAAGRLAHSALDLAEELIRPGLTTEEMDKELHTFICDHGAYPSDLQYKGVSPQEHFVD